MRELFSAMLFRLRRSGIFWACCIAGLLIAGCIGLGNGFSDVHSQEMFNEPLRPLNVDVFEMTPILGFLAAVAVPLFLGAEYGDGAIRNKLIAGHRRENVYLANLFVGTLAGWALLLCAALGGCVAAPLAERWALSLSDTLLTFLGLALSTAVYASLFTLVSMLLSRRAAAPVVSLLLALGLLFLASYLFNLLAEPETVQFAVITVDGFTIPAEPQPNPDYVPPGLTRRLMEFAVRVLPSGQAIRVNQGIVPTAFEFAASLVLYAVTAVLGAGLFRNKDIS